MNIKIKDLVRQYPKNEPVPLSDFMDRFNLKVVELPLPYLTNTRYHLATHDGKILTEGSSPHWGSDKPLLPDSLVYLDRYVEGDLFIEVIGGDCVILEPDFELEVSPDYDVQRLLQSTDVSFDYIKEHCTVVLDSTVSFKTRMEKGVVSRDSKESNLLTVYYKRKTMCEYKSDLSDLDIEGLRAVERMVRLDKSVQTYQDVLDVIKQHIDSTDHPTMGTLYEATGISIGDLEPSETSHWSDNYILKVNLGAGNPVVLSEPRYYYEERFSPTHDFDTGLRYEANDDGATSLYDGAEVEFVFDGTNKREGQ